MVVEEEALEYQKESIDLGGKAAGRRSMRDLIRSSRARSGYYGVYLDTRTQKWFAQVYNPQIKKLIRLGSNFAKREQAARVVARALAAINHTPGTRTQQTQCRKCYRPIFGANLIVWHYRPKGDKEGVVKAMHRCRHCRREYERENRAKTGRIR